MSSEELSAVASQPSIDLEKEPVAIKPESHRGAQKLPLFPGNRDLEKWVEGRLRLANSNVSSAAKMYHFLETARPMTHRLPYVTIEAILAYLCIQRKYMNTA